MANPDHLAKLKEGVEAWNHWREENVEMDGGRRVLARKIHIKQNDLTED